MDKDDGPMAGNVRHLITRAGRYHARPVVAKGLRGIVGKTELRDPLGADQRQASQPIDRERTAAGSGAAPSHAHLHPVERLQACSHLGGVHEGSRATVGSSHCEPAPVSAPRKCSSCDRLPENVAVSVKQPKPRRRYGRECGYTHAEAIKVFAAARDYAPRENKTGRSKTKYLTAASRWCPIIFAFTGARISEIALLRKEDVRKENGRWIIRITPEAGSVKAEDFRDIPLHQQLIDLGF